MVNIKLQVVEGDITRITSDAIITAINSGRMWYGGIDSAIKRSARDRYNNNDFYHAQAAAKMPLKNLQTVIARGFDLTSFRDVVFVVDDLKSPLNQVVYTGLEAASNEGYQKVLVPTIRMGVMNGIVEKTEEEAIQKMALGVRNFLEEYSKQTKLVDISFVVYNNPSLAKKLDRAFG